MKKSGKGEPPPKKKFNMFNYFPTVNSNETTSTEDGKKGYSYVIFYFVIQFVFIFSLISGKHKIKYQKYQLMCNYQILSSMLYFILPKVLKT